MSNILNLYEDLARRAPPELLLAARCCCCCFKLLLLALLLLLLLFARPRCCSPRAAARAPARPPARLPAGRPARLSAASPPPTYSAHEQQQQRANEHQSSHQKQVDSAAALTPVGPVGRPPGFRLAVVGARALCAPWGPTLGRRCAPESLREVTRLMSCQTVIITNGHVHSSRTRTIHDLIPSGSEKSASGARS